MKPLLLLLLFLAPTVQAHDELNYRTQSVTEIRFGNILRSEKILQLVQVLEELDYKTHYLFMWTGNCTHRLISTYQAQGMPRKFAFSLASQGCSCVIDKFRETYTHTELLSLSEEEREEQSLYFAQVCGGAVKEM